MNFVNNWNRPITLAPGVTSIALDIADGEYRLTITDDPAASTRWEIVDATVASGTATLVRGLEGTINQDWPLGSVIYNSLTAGVLAELAGANSVIVAEEPPVEADIPPSQGARYVVPGKGAWLALGIDYGSDWARVAGLESVWGFEFNPGTSFEVPYEARNLRVELSSPVDGAFAGTLILPWEGVPYGLAITIFPAGAESFSLQLDLSAMGQLGFFSAENHGVQGVTMSAEGSVLSVITAEPCTVSILDKYTGVDDFEITLRIERAEPITFI